MKPSWPPGPVARLLVLVALSFTLASVTGNLITYDPGNPLTYPSGPTFPQKNRYVEWFSLDLAGTLPMWYTALLFLSSAIMAGAPVIRCGRSRRHALYWTALSLVFMGLSADKLFHLHQMAPAGLRDLSGSGWMVWGLTGGAALYVSWRILPYRTLIWLGVGAALCLGSYEMDRFGEAFAGRHSGHHMMAAFIGDAEGMLEMLGAISLLHGLMVCDRRGAGSERETGG